MTQKEFAIHVLEQNCPFDAEFMGKILYGFGKTDSISLKSAIEETMGKFGEEKASGKVDEDIITDILCGMSKYICGYRAITLYKQKLYNSFREWIYCIAKYYNITDPDELIEEFLVQPVKEDPVVAFVKSLHANSGSSAATKAELAKQFCVDEKTIRNRLNQFDPGLNRDKKRKKDTEKYRVDILSLPRFGGQLVQVDVKRTVDKRVHRFYTPESLHPIALQMNVSQVGILLKGLQLANNADISDNSMDMAMDIWTQLSSYCQQRLMNRFRPQDEELHDFLNLVDEVSRDEGTEHLFKTELEMFEDESIRSRMEMACKGEHPCNVLLKNSDKAIKNCMIKYQDGKFYICCRKIKQEVNANDIRDIRLFRE